jgi:hypothetical protein
MRTRHLVAGVLLGGLVLLAWAEDSEALLIDDFSTDQTVIWLGAPDTVSSQVSGAGILGGERDMVATLISNVGIVMAASGNSLTYLNALNSEGTGLIVWDGADDDPAVDPTGLGGIDFTAGGEDEIAIPLLASNLLAPMILTAYTDGANYSTATVWLPGNVPPDVRLRVFFTDFSTAAGSGADFTNIGALSLFIDGSSTPGLTAGLSIINPEPSTATLLLLGIVGIVTIRRCGWTP